MYHTMCLITPPAFTWYSTRLPMDCRLRLSRPRCLVLHRGSLPIQRRSAVQALTGPSVDELHWSSVFNHMSRSFIFNFFFVFYHFIIHFYCSFCPRCVLSSFLINEYLIWLETNMLPLSQTDICCGIDNVKSKLLVYVSCSIITACLYAVFVAVGRCHCTWDSSSVLLSSVKT